MDKEAKRWHDQYEQSSSWIQSAVDDATSLVMNELKMRQFITCGDDRAEELAAAITKYLLVCSGFEID